jgi:glycosyltransferase involved in cell wall biosynthesis
MTVVVPCFNEAENIRPAYTEIVAELGGYDALELLFVDDGSTDGTLAEIKAVAAADDRVHYLSFTRNFGLESAFSAGYRYAGRDWVLHLDADLQFPPAEARRLVLAATAGNYDAVFGVRVDRKDRWLRRAASGLHDFIARRLLHIEIPPGATTFRLVRTALARRIVELDLGTPYFLANVPRLTNAWTTVPTEHRARVRGEPKVNIRGLARHAMGLFTSYSDRPMAAAAGAMLLATLLCLTGAITAIFGGLTATFELFGLAGVIGFAALFVTVRYLVHIARGQPSAPKYLVREANLPIAAADLLAPLPANRSEVA